MVKETFSVKGQDRVIIYGKVSIPSRGSGKGDLESGGNYAGMERVSIPSRGSGKGDETCLT